MKYSFLDRRRRFFLVCLLKNTVSEGIFNVKHKKIACGAVPDGFDLVFSHGLTIVTQVLTLGIAR